MLTTTRGPICVVGTGASTSVGLNAPATAAAVRAGVAAMAFHPFMIDKMGAPMVVCANPALPIELGTMDRFLEPALTAAHEALEPLLAKVRKLPRISILLALPEERPGMPEHFESMFTERFSSVVAKEVNIQDFTCHSLGHAGGLLCMEQALSLILNGKSQMCLVGGVDSYLAPETLEWLDDLEQLHSETTIWGFCPGEGAGFCLLTSWTFATDIGLSSDIDLVAAASCNEPNPIKTETVCIGQGLTEAFRKSFAFLPIDSHINQTICDMNGEPYRGNEYGFAMLRTTASFAEDADFMTPADCWGDVGAASGPLFAILAAFAAKKGYSPGPCTLLWASSEGGLRGTALLRSSTTVMKGK
jgi:3-oxoacyl-[acyl-carrier-protein] synthase-1